MKGKKSILVIATGFDTLQQTHPRSDAEAREGNRRDDFLRGNGAKKSNCTGAAHIDYLQAKNEMNTFAEMTGGYAWFPRFEGEMPDIFNSVATFLRSQYTIGFTPNTASGREIPQAESRKRWITQGNPLTTADKKGKHEESERVRADGYTFAETAAINAKFSGGFIFAA